MKTTHPFHAITLIASGAVGECCLVRFDGAQASTAGEKVAGVARFNAGNLEAITVDVSGIVLVKTGAAIAQGDSLVSDANGQAVPALALAVDAGVTAVGSTAANGPILVGGDLPEFVFGDAMEAASGAGQLVQVLLRR
ncbi:MAG: DUF2190 family protein [Magnetococcales bacterium]|nr:DUF2190 family protein [Magnetococcales bacterium]